MSLEDWRRDLRDAAYELLDLVGVLIPYQLWHVVLVVEQERPLRLSEETVLRLVDAGLCDPREIGTAMGLRNDEVLRHVIVDLLRGSYLVMDDERLVLTPSGRRASRVARARVSQRLGGIDVLFDPYRDELGWYGEPKLLSISTARRSGVARLPVLARLDHEALRQRHVEVDGLIGRYGIPGDREPEVAKELVIIEPTGWDPVYKRADLEIWGRPSDRAISWRLVQGDIELRDETRGLRQLESEGVRIIPFARQLDTP